MEGLFGPPRISAKNTKNLTTARDSFYSFFAANVGKTFVLYKFKFKKKNASEMGFNFSQIFGYFFKSIIYTV